MISPIRLAVRPAPHPGNHPGARSVVAALRAWRSTLLPTAAAPSPGAASIGPGDTASTRSGAGQDRSVPASLGQRRDNGLATPRHPAFAPVADRMHRQHKLLHQVDLVAFEA